MRYLLLFLSTFLIFTGVAQENLKDWKSLSGTWKILNGWISAEFRGKTANCTIIRNDLQEESRWEVISTDFRIENNVVDTQFGLLLNVRNEGDYQVLRICNFSENPVIQLLRWQYGQFRMWQEYKLPAALVPEKKYQIKVCRAPMVDKEDWRQWKIILSDKTSGQIILKQGIENEHPAFGLGIVGLYIETSGIAFQNFELINQKCLASSGSLRLAPVFNDRMVLQQHSKIAIWGKANPYEKVKIELAGSIYRTVSAKSGDWRISIPPLKTQNGLTMKVATEMESITVHDIAVGEVWMASGQSNMEMRVWQTDVSELSKEIVTDDSLRFFLQPQWVSPIPNFDSGGEWVKADSASVKGWSAVALSFALELRRKLHVPVGIISSNWGGTAIESWIPCSRLSTDSLTLPILKRVNRYQSALEKGELVEERFPWCWDVPGQRHTPGNLFNAMIAPHIPFVIKGVIWYQGESNSNRAKQYEHLFPMLISSWRELWQNPKMGFYFVQLASYDGKQSGSEIEDAWPHLRESQRLTLNMINHAGMAVTVDLGQMANIHPPFKKEVGTRLSRLVLHDIYGFRKIVRSSPLYLKAIFKSNEAIICFSETGQGLKILNDMPLGGFSISGEDGRFVPATANIRTDGRSVRVFCKNVRNPVAVRYAWENFPKNANLGNSANLPASPFRTDNWFLNTDNDR